ncbi:MAG: hypothetical protein AAB426_01430 [Myxococcota bacterium]
MSIASRDSLDLRVQFDPAARGAFRAELVVASNAENYPTLRIELVAPATEGAVPCESSTMTCVPDIAAIDDALSVTGSASVTSMVLARLFNVGGAPLRIDGYAISGADASAFAFPAGTATPGVSCTPEGGCPAGASCLAEQGGGNACAPVWLSAGLGLVVPVEYVAIATGSHMADLTITSNDGDTAEVQVGLAGTYP